MNAKEILEKHRSAKFPSFPDNDDFANWVEELTDLDGYYYGLATSLLAGEKKHYNVNLFQEMKQRLYKFRNLEADKEVYQECEKYLSSLENIVKLIHNKSRLLRAFVIY
jgi:hypothetical protein